MSFYQKIVLKIFAKMSEGCLKMTLPDGETLEFGDSKLFGKTNFAEIIVKDNDFFKRCFWDGNIGLAEAYIEKLWETPSITSVIEWFITNINASHELQGSSQNIHSFFLKKLKHRMGHLLRNNNRKNARKNIYKHYDIGNNFYSLWLDKSMTYSSAIFDNDNNVNDLELAQENKYEKFCQKLNLQKSDNILEIGCGWGGFISYAVRKYGCSVTGVTISTAQYDYAKKRIQAEGLQDNVTLKLLDYRDIKGKFDKIISIEMLEAVGRKYLPAYFTACSQLLKKNGLLGLQFITVPDNRFEKLSKGVDFIQKHIFPGSLLLSIKKVNELANKKINFNLINLEDIGYSYAKTLKIWHENFNQKYHEITKLGFDEYFIRKWNYYLNYCQAGFHNKHISVVQAIYAPIGIKTPNRINPNNKL